MDSNFHCIVLVIFMIRVHYFKKRIVRILLINKETRWLTFLWLFICSSYLKNEVRCLACLGELVTCTSKKYICMTILYNFTCI